MIAQHNNYHLNETEKEKKKNRKKTGRKCVAEIRS